ncbi:type VI secretion system tip protein TssI/VgrG [Comamonas sp. JUb58]|uniref:type VI secretion system Vgr family protein n=1 Tax=Comamonas sp. JUb58 TaxID=2485114 RepID=UPI00105BDD4A|nr:type VI secretion system tip protein TssI/VgrG [Comamonas sp. JUb58]TDS81680.1 type VI secretion system secreted protein VgrG [Comamonas sp. JUb58]
MVNRTFIAHSPLGEELQFRSLDGSEQISRLFEYRVRLISESQGISAKSLLGKDMSIEIDLTTKLHGSARRFLSGQITQFSFSGKDGAFYAYEAVLRPWLWHATRRTDFKIFQFKTVPEIVQEVLAPYGFVIDQKLIGNYRSWKYLVQYGESDFNFVSRLLEMEGAYFFFEHHNGSHTLVLADDIGSHTPLPQGTSTHPYYPGDRAAQVRDEDFVDSWAFAEDIASGHFAADDYDFERPRAILDTRQEQPAGHSEDSRERYDWPGGYTDVTDGENYARVRIEQQQAQREMVQGDGNARNIAPGYLFTFSKYPRSDQNKEYLIESASYRFAENVHRSDGGGADHGASYRIRFSAVPKSTAYRSQRNTPKPGTTGPQTAVVTGPPNEEIYTDKFGRVKVQFHWDRYGTKDENSSCWIRVSQTWAGSSYGSMHIPRIGQEVIVDFLNGDPDYPIITGRVYNAMQMPPWDLPANKTQSGIKTRSSKGGAPGAGEKDGAGDANAIRFEDKKGQEQLWLHAQKDQLTEVENDEDKWVGNDRRKVIDRDEFNTIHRDRTEVVDRNEKINVHGWRTEEVDLDETLTVHQNRQRRVDLKESVDIGISRDKTVGRNETDDIGNNWTINVGVLKAQTIGMAYLQNVGAMKMMNIGVNYMQNIGMFMQTHVGLNQSLNVGENQSTKVGSKQTTQVGEQYSLTVGGGGGGGRGGSGGGAEGASMNIVSPGGEDGGGGGGKASNLRMTGQNVTITAANIRLEAQQEIIFSCGDSTLKITPGRIEILSPEDRLNC